MAEIVSLHWLQAATRKVSALRLSMPHIVVGDPNDVTQRTNVSMIEGFDQSPSHDIHITLMVSVFRKVPVAGKVSVLLGYVLLLKSSTSLHAEPWRLPMMFSTA